MTDLDLKTLITSSEPLGKASLATRILLNRLRVEARAKPASLPDKIAELRAHLARNPAAATELSLT